MVALPSAGSATDAMNRIYRHQRLVYDATRKHYLLGRDAMIANLAVPDGGTVLEIGCGTARNLLHAAGLYPTASLYGIDVSAEMLKTAHRSVGKSPAAGRIRLAEADATSFDAARLFGQPHFDRIFISYALSMIPLWRRALEEAVEALDHDGELHIVDFGRMERMPPFARVGLERWLKKFSVTPRHDLRDATLSVSAALQCSTRFHESQRGYSAHAIIKRPR